MFFRSVREQLLFVVARDNTEQIVAEDLLAYPKWVHALAQVSLDFDDMDGRWQMAVALGASPYKGAAEKLLTKMNEGDDEFVSRMALLALANLGSALTEPAALRAWKTNDEYQRIAVLWAMYRIKSANLPKYIEAAKKDGREHLMANLAKITG